MADFNEKMQNEIDTNTEETVKIHLDEESAQVTAVEGDYGANQIQILEGLEAVRKRPGMYIGSTSARGLHHLVYEVVDNSIDEALAGYCTHIEVTIHKDNSITVTDNGRGIPVDMHESGKPAVEVVLTVLHAGGKFGGSGYKVSGGLHGVGVSVVNALSTSMDVKVKRDGKVYEISFEKGVTKEPLHVIGETAETGTYVHFVPDAEIFDETVYDYDTLRHRLRELSFLNRGITIILTDERPEEVRQETFYFEGGISSFVEHLNRNKEVINPEPVYFNGTKDTTVVEIALQYNTSYSENIYSFVNNINTEEGGDFDWELFEGGFGSAPYINYRNQEYNYYIEENGKQVGINRISVRWHDEDSPEKKLQRIITQKWISFFPTLSSVAWSEYRRTGYPKLIPIPSDLNYSNGAIDTELQIRRLPFTQSEYRGNTEEVNKALGLLKGPDNGGTRLWWDVDKGNFE